MWQIAQLASHDMQMLWALSDKPCGIKGVNIIKTKIKYVRWYGNGMQKFMVQNSQVLKRENDFGQ